MQRQRLSTAIVALGLGGITLGAVTLSACDSADDGSGGTTTTAVGGTGGAGGAGGAGVVRLTIFHTSDEHGWLPVDDVSAPGQMWGGAAEVMGWLVSQDGYVPGEQLLVSSGDNWTGAAASTWFEGEPMVEVFNAMGYAAAAIGNHEFDFGQDGLAARVAQASYPHLSANVFDEQTGELASFATPYVVVPVQGVQVGIVGLAHEGTGQSAHPKLVEGLEFGAYQPALEQTVPEARAAGAEVIVVLAHVCAEGLQYRLPLLNVEIDVALAGHCHDFGDEDIDGVPLVSSGYYFHGYSRIDLDFDRAIGEVVHHEVDHRFVTYAAGEPNPVTPDPDVAAIVADWEQQADALLGQVIGHSNSGLAQGDWPMSNWIVDSWLWAYPEADVAIQNFGSLRQAIPVGPFTVGDVVGMLPFANNLVLIEITGAQLVAELTRGVTSCPANSSCYPGVGGMRYEMQGSDLQVTLDGGAALDPMAIYTVLMTDYLYYGGGGGYGFAALDPAPIDTGAHMRQPVLDWTIAQATSTSDPIEDHIDPLPRDE